MGDIYKNRINIQSRYISEKENPSNELTMKLSFIAREILLISIVFSILYPKFG